MDAKDIAEELQDTNVVEPEAEAPPPEKMLPASQVNELIKKAKRKGEQKMQEQLDAAKQQIEQLQTQQAQQAQQDLRRRTCTRCCSCSSAPPAGWSASWRAGCRGVHEVGENS